MMRIEQLPKDGEAYIHCLSKGSVKKTAVVKSIVLTVFFMWLFLVLSLFIYTGALQILGYQAEVEKFSTSFDFLSLPNGERFIDWVLFLFFPSAYVANRIVFKEKLGEMFSLTGKFRVKWALKCLLFLTPVMLITTVGQNCIDGIPELTLPESFLVSVTLTIVFTTIQCLGEEMLFRAWAIQTFGILFKHRKTAWIVLSIVFAFIFSIIHTPGNFWIGLDLFLFAILMCLLVYHTGGMEAAIIFHTLNNLILNLTELFTVEHIDFSAEQQIVAGDWQGSVLSIALEILCYVLLVWYWKRTRE
ncbi:CPBP family intramembrane glutamic endopeptidase [Streptococcus catagoni]|uniref:CPBP family intramembrane glutamic endopeptidase n=1 Tax=Streptococcus catagoni TaxID=2654874 RepID=UPI00140D0FEE|nr:type II CAAX endopeptidase family protein [Streptococcus catagoni]